MSVRYRELTNSEIEQLKAQGCRADDWSRVNVGEGFDPERVVGCRFVGDVKVGATAGAIEISEGVTMSSGIYYSTIMDCVIGNNCYINNIAQYISNYTVGDGAVIDGASRIVAGVDNRFGNGTRVACINEAGGREVAIYDNLSAQIAYMVAIYRHRPKMVEAYESMVEGYSSSISSECGVIEPTARISGVGTIESSRIASGAKIDGAMQIKNSSINSGAFVGQGVQIKDSILASGAYVDSGTSIKECFVGDAVKLEKSLFAEQSLFFSGSELSLGEACAIFAGPFTVSHHRSSLLIAGMFSFFNAGSGANQSNHLYRTGPVHQGIHRRGCKFGSNAYVMLPALTGAFTLVSGSHKSNHDTESFPFSYLVEDEGKSFLMPGANLRSYGTERDCNKWRARDCRSAQNPDIITFDKYSPYIIERIIKALELSTEMLEHKNSSGIHTYNRVKIKETLLRHGAKHYTMALNIFLAEVLDEEAPKSIVNYSGSWVDMAGMVAPKTLIDKLIERIESRKIADLTQLQNALLKIELCYEDYRYGWALSIAAKQLNKSTEELSQEDIDGIVERGNRDRQSLEATIADDAKKDSSQAMATGYGADDPESCRDKDFQNIRQSQG